MDKKNQYKKENIDTAFIMLDTHIVYVTQYRYEVIVTFILDAPETLLKKHQPEVADGYFGSSLKLACYFARIFSGSPIEIVKKYIESGQKPKSTLTDNISIVIKQFIIKKDIKY